MRLGYPTRAPAKHRLVLSPRKSLTVHAGTEREFDAALRRLGFHRFGKASASNESADIAVSRLPIFVSITKSASAATAMCHFCVCAACV